VRFSLPVQTGPEAHLASYTVCTVSLSWGLKRPDRDGYPSASSIEVKEEVQLYLYSPSRSLWRVLWRSLPLAFNVKSGFAGHVMRMQDKLPCKKINLDKPEGRRRAGRPKLRWIGGVKKDAEKLGVRNWRARARDRDDWRRLLESAKTLHGL